MTRPRALNSPIAFGKRSTPFGAPGRRRRDRGRRGGVTEVGAAAISGAA